MRRTACQGGGVPGGRLTAAARRCGTTAVVCAAVWMAEPSGAVLVAQAPRAACADDMARTPVRLHLIDRAGLSDLTKKDMRREALRPWLSIGADVAWSENLPKGAARRDGGDDLYVIAVGHVTEGDAGAGQDPPLASIRFVDGRPTTHITMYASDVARRLDDARVEDGRLGNRPREFRDRLLGRVLGRALAHELGHFLLASNSHAAAGLMRAGHRLDRMMARTDRGFDVALPASPQCLVARLDWR
jgi:hypothetical protein